MEENGVDPDLITFSTMIKGYCKKGHLDQAFRMLEMMNLAHIMPDEVLFNSLLDGCARTNQQELGFKVFESMQQKGINPSNVTFSILIKLYAKARQNEKAIGIIDQMKKAGVKPGNVVYTCLIKTFLQARQVKTAIEIYETMIKDSVIPDSVTYSTLIEGCLQNGKISEAADIIIHKQQPCCGSEEKIYSEVVKALNYKKDAKSMKQKTMILELIKNAIKVIPKEPVSFPADSTSSFGGKWRNKERIFKPIQPKSKSRSQFASKIDDSENMDMHNISSSTAQKSKFSAFIERSTKQTIEPYPLTTKPASEFAAKEIDFNSICKFQNSRKTPAPTQNLHIS